MTSAEYTAMQLRRDYTKSTAEIMQDLAVRIRAQLRAAGEYRESASWIDEHGGSSEHAGELEDMAIACLRNAEVFRRNLAEMHQELTGGLLRVESRAAVPAEDGLAYLFPSLDVCETMHEVKRAANDRYNLMSSKPICLREPDAGKSRYFYGPHEYRLQSWDRKNGIALFERM